MATGVELRTWWWRPSALRGWLQLLSGADLRVVSSDPTRRPVLVTSFDLVGNVSLAVADGAFGGLPADARDRLVAAHCAAVRRETARLGVPERSIGRLIMTVRIGLLTVLAGGPIAGGEVRSRLAEAALALAVWLLAQVVAPWLVHRLLRWYVGRLLQGWH